MQANTATELEHNRLQHIDIDLAGEDVVMCSNGHRASQSSPR